MTDSRRGVIPIVVLYENPVWFERLFAALEHRGVPYRKLLATEHVLDPGSPSFLRDAPPGDQPSTRADGAGGASVTGDAGDAGDAMLIFNRMSASAATRGHGDTLWYAGDLLSAFELRGIPVVNGSRAYAFEVSKAKQLALLGSLGLRVPATRVAHRAAQVEAAAHALRFPIVLKPNVGGRGAGIVRFDDAATLRDAARAGTLDFGADSVALLQEYVPKRDGKITRVEIVGGEFLYAIDVRTVTETFDLCPADICAPRNGAVPANVSATVAQPPDDAIRDVERICRAAGIEVGGVEYLVDERDGSRLYYDINALSNFVAGANELLGFDPWERLVDFLQRRATDQEPAERVRSRGPVPGEAGTAMEA